MSDSDLTDYQTRHLPHDSMSVSRSLNMLAESSSPNTASPKNYVEKLTVEEIDLLALTKNAIQNSFSGSRRDLQSNGPISLVHACFVLHCSQVPHGIPA